MLDGRTHSVSELTAVLGTSRRNFYYVLQSLESMGFRVVRENHTYALDRDSHFLQAISNSVDFTEAEAAYLHGKVCEDAEAGALAGTLKRKLERFYHLDTHVDVQERARIVANTEMLGQAMAHKRVVILHGYSSPHSRSVTDRVVEPFLFQGDGNDVRAYELRSKQNKTFKIARIDRVEMVDTPWFHEDSHREVFTDMFMFSGEEQHEVRLRLGLLAHHLMLEEYPHSRSMMVQEDEAHWLFSTRVASYVGIARFILGLYSEIEVLGDDGLQRFLQAKIADMASRLP